MSDFINECLSIKKTAEKIPTCLSDLDSSCDRLATAVTTEAKAWEGCGSEAGRPLFVDEHGIKETEIVSKNLEELLDKN